MVSHNPIYERGVYQNGGNKKLYIQIKGKYKVNRIYIRSRTNYGDKERS